MMYAYPLALFIEKVSQKQKQTKNNELNPHMYNTQPHTPTVTPTTKTHKDPREKKKKQTTLRIKIEFS